MVYGVCMRRTGDRQLAEELTQNVFATLARKSGTIKKDVTIAGWLHRASCFESLHALRAEKSRKRTMKNLKELRPLETSISPKTGNDLAPLLDDAIDQLPATDRDVLLMRFASERTLRQIGGVLGKSESAAQRHLQRALEKLSIVLRKRGIVAGTISLTAYLGADFANATPSPLVASAITKSALANVTSLQVSSAWAAGSQFIAANKTVVAAGACLIGAAASALYVGNLKSEAHQAVSTAGNQANTQLNTASRVVADSSFTPLRNVRRPASPEELQGLIERFGKSRVRLASQATADYADIMEMFSMLKVMTGAETGVTTVDPTVAVFADMIKRTGVTEAQQLELDRLLADHKGRRLDESTAFAQNVRDNPSEMMELMLSSDATARGDMAMGEYKEIEDRVTRKVGSTKKITSDYLTGVINDSQLMGEIRTLFNDDQNLILEKTLEEWRGDSVEGFQTAENEEGAASGAPKFPPMALEKRQDSLTRKKLSLEGIMQVIEANRSE